MRIIRNSWIASPFGAPRGTHEYRTFLKRRTQRNRSARPATRASLDPVLRDSNDTSNDNLLVTPTLSPPCLFFFLSCFTKWPKSPVRPSPSSVSCYRRAPGRERGTGATRCFRRPHRETNECVRQRGHKWGSRPSLEGGRTARETGARRQSPASQQSEQGARNQTLPVEQFTGPSSRASTFSWSSPTF